MRSSLEGWVFILSGKVWMWWSSSASRGRTCCSWSSICKLTSRTELGKRREDLADFGAENRYDDNLRCFWGHRPGEFTGDPEGVAERDQGEQDAAGRDEPGQSSVHR